MKSKIRIMLVEDHPEYREVIEIAIGREPEMELAGKFGAAEIALRTLQNMAEVKGPDVILLDLNLPGMSGLDAIPWFKKYSPDSKIIVLSQSDRETDVLQAIQLGASGYLLKSSTVPQVKEGIRTVLDGGAPLDARIALFILNTLKKKIPENPQETSLSEREMEILTLLANGLAKKEIADRLGISTTTVITHVNRIYKKLNAANAPAAISKAYQTGINSEGEDMVGFRFSTPLRHLHP